MSYSSLTLRARNAKGFTLVEVLVYIAVLVLVAGMLVTTFLSLDTVLIRNKTERVLASEAKVTLDRMVFAIRQADQVNIGLSTLDASPGVLVLEGDTEVRFYLSSGVLMVEEDGTDVGPITSDAVTVQNIEFNHYSGTISDLVRVSLTLSSESKVASTTRTFYTSATIRGSYE